MLAQAARSELHAILEWWINRMTDVRQGGFYGRIDGHGRLQEQAEKGVILNTRILWTFSAAARCTGNSAYAQTARRAYDYCCAHFIDHQGGGVYWSLTASGAPAQTKKQVYAQAFAVYALSEYYLLTKHEDALQQALDIFDVLEKKALDRHQNGYLEAFSRDWQALADQRLSEKDANEAKTQNTHLHLLEAYTNLYRAAPANEALREALRNLINLFLEKFIDPASSHIHLFFDENWNLKSDIVSYGHDIEASWLLWEAAEALGEAPVLEKLKPICLQMAETTLREAVDADGAVQNEWQRGSGHLDADRIWWVQAEALVGFRNAWKLSGDARFEQAAHGVWRFIQEKQRDAGGGEWFWRVSRAGIPSFQEDKAGFWKCPYHNGRAMMKMM